MTERPQPFAYFENYRASFLNQTLSMANDSEDLRARLIFLFRVVSALFGHAPQPEGRDAATERDIQILGSAGRAWIDEGMRPLVQRG